MTWKRWAGPTVAAGLVVACSGSVSESDNNQGVGGTQSNGGASGTGGSTSPGGSGTAGQPPTGGTAGVGAAGGAGASGTLAAGGAGASGTGAAGGAGSSASGGTAGAAAAGAAGTAASGGTALGQCDSGKGGSAGAFYNPNTAMCVGRSPMIADKKGWAVFKPPCEGQTPLCQVEPCDASTEPLFCCGDLTPVCVPCPAGMVSTGEFCIDETEVTRAAYAAWLLTNPAPQAFPGCEDYAPDPSCLAAPETCQSGCDNHPQVCVDSCDARTYCGARGLGVCNAEQAAAACATAYPYGDPYDSKVCNGLDSGLATTAPVASFPGCVSPVAYGNVYDLSGNVAEWGIDKTHGGGYADGAAFLTCAAERDVAATTTSPAIGFRCCSAGE